MGARDSLLHRHFGSDSPLSDEERAVLESVRLPGERKAERAMNWSPALAKTLEELGEGAFPGDLERAGILFQLALRCRLRLKEPEDEALAKCSYILALLLKHTGQWRIARDVLEATLRLREKIFGKTDQGTLFCANELGILLLDLDEVPKACQLLQRTLQRARIDSAANENVILACEGNLADGLRGLGRLHDAYRLGKRVYESRMKKLGLSNRETLASLNNLAFICRDLGRLSEAQRLQELVVKARQRLKGGDPRDLTTAYGNLAVTLYQLGDSERALEMERKVLTRRLKEDGAHHLDTLIAMNNLSGSLRDLGEFTEARRLLQNVIHEAEQQELGDHHETVTAYMNLADLLVRFSEFDLAESYARKAYAIRLRRSGPKHPDTLLTLSSLAAILWERGERGKSLRMRRKIARFATSSLGPNHGLSLLAGNDLAGALAAQGEQHEAVELYRDITRRSLRLFGTRHGDMLTARTSLAESLLAIGRDAEAVREAWRVVRALSQKTFAFTEDYALAQRSFSILARHREPNLANQFREIGALLRHSLETLDSRSLQLLRPTYLAFTYVWLDYCREEELGDITLPLIAAQGFDEVVANLDQLSDGKIKAADSIERLQTMLKALRDVRQSIHELNGRLADKNFQRSPDVRKQLETEYQRQVGEEEKLSAWVRRLNRAADHEGAFGNRAGAAIDVSLATLTRILPAGTSMVIVYRTGGNFHEAVVLSGGTRKLVGLHDFSSFTDSLASSSRRGRAEKRLAGYRYHMVLEGKRGASTNNVRSGQLFDRGALASLGRQSFWEPLRKSGMLGQRILVVTTLGLQGQPLDCGNPGLETSYHTSVLSAYRSLKAGKPVRESDRGVIVTCDAAWQTRNPIPFVEAEAKLLQSIVSKTTVLTPRQFRSQLTRKHFAQGAQISIACHGASIGDSGKHFSILAIDLEKHIYVSPLDFQVNTPDVKTLYLSACMGGVGSDALEGDPFGLVGSLQRIGNCSVVASPAPLPDYYMPVFTALYWSELITFQPSSRALQIAKERFRTGSWSEELLPPIRRAYRNGISKVLSRYHRIKSRPSLDTTRSRLILAATSNGWLWPNLLEVAGNEIAWKGRSALELFDLCSTPRLRDSLATQLADHLIDSRTHLPARAVEYICDFMMSFGS